MTTQQKQKPRKEPKLRFTPDERIYLQLLTNPYVQYWVRRLLRYR